MATFLGQALYLYTVSVYTGRPVLTGLIGLYRDGVQHQQLSLNLLDPHAVLSVQLQGFTLLPRHLQPEPLCNITTGLIVCACKHKVFEGRNQSVKNKTSAASEIPHWFPNPYTEHGCEYNQCHWNFGLRNKSIKINLSQLFDLSILHRQLMLQCGGAEEKLNCRYCDGHYGDNFSETKESESACSSPYWLKHCPHKNRAKFTSKKVVGLTKK